MEYKTIKPAIVLFLLLMPLQVAFPQSISIDGSTESSSKIVTDASVSSDVITSTAETGNLVNPSCIIFPVVEVFSQDYSLSLLSKTLTEYLWSEIIEQKHFVLATRQEITNELSSDPLFIKDNKDEQNLTSEQVISWVTKRQIDIAILPKIKLIYYQTTPSTVQVSIDTFNVRSKAAGSSEIQTFSISDIKTKSLLSMLNVFGSFIKSLVTQFPKVNQILIESVETKNIIKQRTVINITKKQLYDASERLAMGLSKEEYDDVYFYDLDKKVKYLNGLKTDGFFNYVGFAIGLIPFINFSGLQFAFNGFTLEMIACWGLLAVSALFASSTGDVSYAVGTSLIGVWSVIFPFAYNGTIDGRINRLKQYHESRSDKAVVQIFNEIFYSEPSYLLRLPIASYQF